jgi:BASS family bile acid:Na+ symporter
MSGKDLVLLAFEISLLLTVFGFGLRATPQDVLYLFHRPWLLLRSVLSLFVLMPVAAMMLVSALGGPWPVKIVILALAISPIPPMLPKTVAKSGALSSYGLGLLDTASVISIAIVPLAVYMLGLYYGHPLTTSFPKVVTVMVEAVLGPIAAGMFFKSAFPGLADLIETTAGRIAQVLLVGATAVSSIASIPTIWSLVSWNSLIMMTTFVLIGLALGHIMASPGIERQSVLAVATASRHPGIALTLASDNYPDEEFGGIILLYLAVSAVICLAYIQAQRMRAAASDPITAH